MAQTVFDKIWNEHVVSRNAGFPDILYIDAHLINKITSPVAFEGLRKRHIPVYRPNQTIAITEQSLQRTSLSDTAGFQLDMLNRNCNDFGLNRIEQHRPEQVFPYFSYPGQTIVCDKKFSDILGALGSIAIGISELHVEQVLATQCMLIHKPKRMKIEVNGKLKKGLKAKDINHYLMSEISANGANGYFIEYAGDTILNLEIEERMAICKMSKEIGAFGGLIAPDEKVFSYLQKNGLIIESANQETEAYRSDLYSDDSAVFDEVLEFDAEDIGPGNYGIDLSKLIQSTSNPQSVGIINFNGSAILSGINDTDYLLSRLENIEEFENSKDYKIFNGD
jgi:3-isopropylmalate/(R)-2-methylmalate dehydratase large subunit